MPTMLVVEHDPVWSQRFEQLRDHIWPAICDVATTIEHVGSTAVLGLAAKPIIDLTIVVPDAACIPQVIERLATLGYQHRGDLGVPGREAFARPTGTIEHHLYACVAGNQGLRNHLAVRDYLRQHPEVAAEYGDLKRSLAQQFSDDIDGYIEGKSEFILRILAATGFTADEQFAIEKINRKPPV